MAPKLGDVIPDLSFLRPDGSTVHLADFSAKALVVIFLRHLA